jgi:outer membrane protein TolC
MMDAGKVSATDVILIERELLDGRLGYVEARVEFAVAIARVRTAAGLPILDGAAGGGR